MIARHVTLVHFVLAVAAGLASVALAVVLGAPGLLLVLASAVYTVWAVRKSDHKGFVKSAQMRRAFEPERHFGAAQVVVLMGLLMLQALVAAYLLVR